jgi:hypothetical protein
VKKISLLMLSLLCTFSFSLNSFANQSYPMVCRGGAGTLGYAPYKALFYFTKSARPSGAGLQPGQCSWVDRAIGQNEPTCLQQSGVNDTAWIFPANRAASYFTSASGSWLRSLLDATTYKTFKVYNPGDGNCFVVTGVN